MRNRQALPRWIKLYDDDGSVEIRDRRSGALRVTTPPGAIGVPIGGADETSAVSVHGNGDVRTWDLERGESRGGWQQENGVAGVALSPDGARLLLWTPDGAALLRDDATLRALAPPADGIIGGALGRQAHEIVLWGRDGRLWLPERPGFEPPPVAGGFCSPRAIGARFLDNDDRQHLLIWNHGACGSARLWDLETQRPVGPVMRHADEIAPPLVQGERLLTWSPGVGPARLWHGATGEAVASLDAAVTGARFAAGDLLLTWDDSEARLWSSQSGEPLGLPLRHAATIREVIASEDGQRLLSRAGDGSLRLWQSPPPPAAMTLQLPAAVLDVALVVKTDEGAVAGEAMARAVSLGGEAYVWSTKGGSTSAGATSTAAAPARHPLDPDAVFAAFAPGGDRLLTASGRGDVRLWNWEVGSFQALASPGGTVGDDPVAGVAWGPAADRLLFWGSQGCTAWLWRVGSARAVPLEHGDAGEGAAATCRLRGAALAGDGSGRALTWGEDRRLRLWDLGARDPVPLETLAEGVLVRTAELDGERLLVASDNGFVTLSRLDGSDADTVLPHATVRGARWDAGGERVLSWGGGSARIWVAEGGTLLASLAHQGEIAEATFAPGGERVLSWQVDGRGQLWDALGGHPLTPALRGAGTVATAVDSDVGGEGLRLLISAGDGITLWRLPAFAAPPARPVHRQEVRTGTRLTIPGEVEVLSAKAWQALAGSEE